MFDAADVLVHGHPVVGLLLVKRRLGIARAGVAQEVPGGADKGVHGVRLPAGGPAAGGAAGLHERRIVLQARDPAARELHLQGQLHRQVLLGNGHRAAAVAVDDGNRRPPVPLAGDQPVPQAVGYFEIALPLFPQVFGDFLHGFPVGQAVETPGIDQDAFPGVGLLHGVAGQVLPWRLDHYPDGQAVLAGKKKVALVVGRNPHYRSRSVAHNHVIAHQDGDGFAVYRVYRMAPGKDPQLLRLGGGPLDLILPPDPLHELQHLFLPFRPRHQPAHQGMLRGQNHVRDPEESIRPGGKGAQLQLGKFLYAELDFGTFAAPDPVLLHDLNSFRPAGELGEILQQPFRIVGYLQEPLAQLPGLYGGGTAPAGPAFHLLIGQHRLAGGAPVDGSLLFIGQPAAVHQEEEPLGPAVVVGMGSIDLPLPVVADPQLLLLLFHLSDILLRPNRGADPVFDGGVFSGQAEGIPAHGVNNIVAPHAQEAGQDIPNGVDAHMSHMQLSRRVGKHLQNIVLGPGGVPFRPELHLLLPAPLPLLFYLPGLVAIHACINLHLSGRLKGGKKKPPS